MLAIGSVILLPNLHLWIISIFFFPSSSESNVKYINIVRSPIERLQSNYYYDLYGDDEHDPENKPEYHKPVSSI